MLDMHKDIERVLYTEEQIAQRVAEMGKQITQDYQEPLLVVSVLSGAAIFMADLVRRIELPVEMDYMAVSSYKNGVKSSGVVQILKDTASSRLTPVAAIKYGADFSMTSSIVAFANSPSS